MIRVHAGHPLGELRSRERRLFDMLDNIIGSNAAIGEFTSGVAFAGTAAYVFYIAEPWAIGGPLSSQHFTLGAVCALLLLTGVAQVFGVLRSWRRARLWIARGAVWSAAVLILACHGISPGAAVCAGVPLFLANILAQSRHELRAAERDRIG